MTPSNNELKEKQKGFVGSVFYHPGELALHPLNSNEHSAANIEELAASLETFQQYKNIVCWSPPEVMTVKDHTGQETELKPGLKYILAGHGLVLAAIKRGWEQIEVKDYSHLTFDQSLLLIETDNAAPLGSQRNPDQMQANLERARALYVDDERMSRMLDRAKELAGANGKGAPLKDIEPQIDKAAELQKVWGTVLGQVWQLGDHRLVVGDCTDKAVVEAVMQGEGADLTVTDPPYGVNYDPAWRGNDLQQTVHGTSIPNDDNFNWLAHFNHNPSDVLYVWLASYWLATVQMGIEAYGYQTKYLIVWNKDLAVFGRGNYHWKHEPCLYLVKKGCKTNWQGGRKETTVWDIPTIHSFKNGANSEEWGLLGHANQKPLECMIRPIRNNSSTGQFVFDPFLGSGTTLIACEQLNRQCRGIEIEPKYVAVTLDRWATLTHREPVLLI